MERGVVFDRPLHECFDGRYRGGQVESLELGRHACSEATSESDLISVSRHIAPRRSFVVESMDAGAFGIVTRVG
jgi:hypothetical protein